MKSWILLPPKRTKRKSVKSLGKSTGGRIVGVVSIGAQPEVALALFHRATSEC